jgi:hypothetical protein
LTTIVQGRIFGKDDLTAAERNTVKAMLAKYEEQLR